MEDIDPLSDHPPLVLMQAQLRGLPPSCRGYRCGSTGSASSKALTQTSVSLRPWTLSSKADESKVWLLQHPRFCSELWTFRDLRPSTRGLLAGRCTVRRCSCSGTRLWYMRASQTSGKICLLGGVLREDHQAQCRVPRDLALVDASGGQRCSKDTSGSSTRLRSMGSFP